MRIAPEDLPASLEPLVRKHIPGTVVVNWKRAEQGFATETYLFDAVDPAGGTTGLVFRRPPEVSLFPDYDLRRQYLVMKRLAATDLPVPAVRWIDTGPTALGSPYFVMDRIDGGSTPSDVPTYHEAGMYFDATPEQRTKIWWGCIDTMARVHRLDPAALRLDFLRMDHLGTDLIEQAINYLDWTVHWASATPAPTIQRALRWLREHRYQPERTTLCWGDSRLSNILYRTDFEVLAVLDWETARLGDPESDLAWLLFTDWLCSEFQGRAKLPGTPSRDEAIAYYERSTGRPVRNLLFNEILSAILLSVPLLRMSSHLGMGDLSAVCVARLDQLLD
ncbi:phosphotransferase family protein [Nocardia sp. XZ_19_385]|uniref:phosphotransferase family protein n=1 Tax=Nocardia sp. XZ_19_385 TaxID=2769488 RepID=UPI001890AB28|nr:phosphotransferase family protein [Nocardia sp. XZ_19_385]